MKFLQQRNFNLTTLECGRLGIHIDATAFKESACPQRLAYTILYGFREKRLSPALAYGIALHKYIGTLRGEKSPEKALLDAIQFYSPIGATYDDKEWRTLEHLIKTCTLYKKHNDTSPLEVVEFKQSSSPTLRMIEQKFSIPIYEDDTYVLFVSGTIDEVGRECGRTLIVDRKTSSSYYKIEETLHLYKNSTQLMLYKYVAEQLFDFAGMGCMIEGIFLSSSAPSRVVKSDIFEHTPYQMSNFKRLLNETIQVLISNLATRDFPRNFLCCDTQRFDHDKVGKCKFFELCTAQDDEEMFNFWLDRNFTIKPYNPLNFDNERE